MDKINFTGGFLIHKPSPRMWRTIQADILPKNKKNIIKDLYEEKNVFIATSKGRDINILKYLLSKQNLKFTFYPNVSQKNRFDAYHPEEAIKILDNEIAISDRKEIRRFIKTGERPVPITEKLPKYKWKENDHIAQTYKALRIEPQDYKAVTSKDNVTILFDRNGSAAVKISPNNQNGMNYAYIYPGLLSDDFKMVKIDADGKIVCVSKDIDRMQEFRKCFMQAVKIDAGRTRPTKKA